MQDADAIRRCLAGDGEAYGAVVRAHADALVGVLTAMLGNAEDGRDVAQETFIRAYSKLHLYDPHRPFRPWLLRVGRNLAYSHLQARRRRPEGQPQADRSLAWTALVSETKSPVEAVWDGERRAAVGRLLTQLKPSYREALVLRFTARLEYEEIARVMDVPIGTVKTWLHRAKAQLRRLAEEQELRRWIA